MASLEFLESALVEIVYLHKISEGYRRQGVADSVADEDAADDVDAVGAGHKPLPNHHQALILEVQF